MRTPLALLSALALLLPASSGVVQGAPEGEIPDCSTTLALPDGGLSLRLQYRQVGPDLARFREPSGADELEVKRLRVMVHLALGSSLTSDVGLVIGERPIRPGRHPLGFTVAGDDTLRFFLVDGEEAFAVASTPLDPGFDSPRVMLQLQYVSRGEARLLWHWKRRAGSIRLGLGSQPLPPEPAAPAER